LLAAGSGRASLLERAFTGPSPRRHVPPEVRTSGAPAYLGAWRAAAHLVKEPA
jgi:hypothetical protein